MTNFSNQIFLMTWLMTSFSKIELNFIVRCFIFSFSDYNNSKNLLKNCWTHVQRILYNFSITCFRTKCSVQVFVSRTFIQCCKSIELFLNIISDNNHVDRKNSSCQEISFWNNLTIVLNWFFFSWNSSQIIKSHFKHARISMSL